MTRARTFVFAVLLAAYAAPARADITAFIGATTTPANRQVKGLSLGVGLLIVGFELEFADTTEDPLVGAPSVQTWMGNLMAQTPGSVYGIQPYVTTGGGIYSETLRTHSYKSFGVNLGGGAKIALIGPVRLRVDYRVFRPGSGALVSPAHRVYVGLNVKF